MLRIVPHTVPRVGRSNEHFPDGFELHLLLPGVDSISTRLSRKRWMGAENNKVPFQNPMLSCLTALRLQRDCCTACAMHPPSLLSQVLCEACLHR